MRPRIERPTKQPSEKFFQTLRERFKNGLSADATDREEAQEDLRFASGGLNQWDPKAVRARKKAKRPVLTENRLGPSIAQIVNDGRQNKPSILCTPMDGGTEEGSEYFQGRIRQLEYECDADVAYDTARDPQVTCGRGFYRVVTRYRGANGDEQYAAIEPIKNSFSVVWDNSAQREDLEDADWFFVVTKISREQHERDFGTDTVASKQGFYLEGAENPAPGWMALGSTGDQVQIADYYYRDYDDLTDDGEPKCKICTTNGIETLDETEWLDPEGVIPVMAQWGKRVVVDDETRTSGLVRDVKDPQKLVNLYVSNIAEEIARMPKTPYMVVEGQIAGRENEWETINEVQRAVIQYKAFVNGQGPLPKPSREVNEPPIQALIAGYLQAIDAIKAGMGIFDASLGAGPGDTAGVAIAQRRTESDVANFHYSDNEARARKKLGRILLRILPLLDGNDPADKPVRSVDGKVRMERINESFTHPKTGKVVHHDMSDPGRYEIGISTGPSYASEREQENARVQEVLKAAPELLWVLGDLYFATSDGPGSVEMADRMKRAIAMKSPGLIEADQNDPRQQLQQLGAQAQGLAQQNQRLTAEVHKLAQILETRKAEADSKFNIAALQSWTQLRVEEIKASLKTGIADADREGAKLEQIFDQAHEVGIQAMGHAHDVLQAQQQQDMQINAPQPQPGAPGAPAGAAPPPVIPPRQPQLSQ